MAGEGPCKAGWPRQSQGGGGAPASQAGDGVRGDEATGAMRLGGKSAVRRAAIALGGHPSPERVLHRMLLGPNRPNCSSG